MAAPVTTPPAFRATFAEDDGAIATRLLAAARREPAAKARIDARATGLIEAIRARRRHRRPRGFHARIQPLHQGGAGADVARRGAAARARRGDAGPADRGQARRRRLGPARDRSPMRSWSPPRPGRSASPPASSIPARRRRASSAGSRSGSACRRCAPRRARRCASSATSSCSARRSRRRCRARGSRRGRLYRHSFDMLGEGARTAADAERYFAILRRARSRRSAAPPATGRCRTGPASRSSSRRCIRATRRASTSA